MGNLLKRINPNPIHFKYQCESHISILRGKAKRLFKLICDRVNFFCHGKCRKLASSSGSELDYVDDFYFSALFDEEDIFPISDEKYAEVLQIQEALMSSIIAMSSVTLDVIRNKEARESSQAFCEICMEGKPLNEMFRNKSCSHSFCTECTGKYVATRIQENINMVTCPTLNCDVVIEPHLCRSFIPQEVLERWENALCEALFMGSQKVYCPYKDCSALFIDEGGEIVKESECPNCWRLFCAQCKVPWHSGVLCEKFPMKENDRKRDLAVVELAKKQKWKKCPQCKFFVEKTNGCIHITCRCGHHFCYSCGSSWQNTHYNCPGVTG